MDQLVGVDFGTQQTMTVLGDGQIVRNELGGHTTATLVAFKNRERLVGEAAVPLVTAFPKNCIPAPHRLAGAEYSTWSARPEVPHLAHIHRAANAGGGLGGVAVEVEYQGESREFTGTELLAAILGKLRQNVSTRIKDLQGGPGEASARRPEPTTACLSCPPAFTPQQRQAMVDAARIAGFQSARVFAAPACACAMYAKKHPVRAGEAQRVVGILEFGKSQSWVAIIQFEEGGTWKTLFENHDDSLGADGLDAALFEHFRSMVKKKYHEDVAPGSKRGARLLRGCEEIRKLLSTIPEAKISVENLASDSDVPLELTRAELSDICPGQLLRLQALVEGALAASPTAPEIFELMGGGSRMPVVQEVFAQMGLKLGSKLDDATLTYGAVLLALAEPEKIASPAQSPPASPSASPKKGKKSPAASPKGSKSPRKGKDMMDVDGGALGLSEEQIAALQKQEQEYQAIDAEVAAINERRNALESFVLDMRGAPSRKHGNLLDSNMLNTFLDEAEEWLYSEELEQATLSMMEEKERGFKAALKEGLAKDYYEAVEKERAEVERSLEEEAKREAEERAANPDGDDADKDYRKLKKPERMRMVQKNKEEGNELLQAGNFSMAGARYAKALTHAAKFFDLGPEDEQEVKALKLTLHLNLAQCYLKLENWTQAVGSCQHALELDSSNPKALYRRAYAYSRKKDWDNANEDLKKVQKITPDDKAVANLAQYVTSEIKKRQAKERSMWSKAFS